ncbi:hypothetical protein F2Q70_00039951 [Brassica cretica]|uniref:Uncharacterized protein n=1 Tax=Brassica cretica TaxID=69181 RepID=A0A8S9K2U3_BRACR|nr:hypothetical protein F2Q70_00039951 [Brassica cretica]
MRRFTSGEKGKGKISDQPTRPRVRIRASDLDTSRLISENALTLIPRNISSELPRIGPSENPSKYPEEALPRYIPRRFPTNRWSSEFPRKFVSSEFRRKILRDFRGKMNFRGVISEDLFLSGGKLLLELAESYIPRRSLATKGPDKCADSVTRESGFCMIVSAYGIHQLHIFIFVLAVVHVIYCNIVTYALGKSKKQELDMYFK